jgi:tetratricopeptide (TPR) repeat protein
VQFEEGLALMRQAGSEQDSTYVLISAHMVSNLARIAWLEGDSEMARKRSEDALALARMSEDWDTVGSVLIFLGRAAGQHGEYELAWSLLEENLRLAREQRREEGYLTVSWAANHLADIARARGDIAEAEALYEESGALFRQQGHTQGIAVALHNLGHIALSRGEVQLAQARFAESLRLFHTLQFTWSIADCLAGLAGVACRQGDAERAALLFGATEAIHQAIDRSGQNEEPANRAAWDRDIAAGRSQIDEGQWIEAWAAGRAMSIEQAVAAAYPSQDEETRGRV